MGFILWLIVGGIAGWLAGRFVKGSGFGLIGDIIIGVIGGYIGGWLFSKLPGIGPNPGLIGQFITALVGAIILTYVIGLFRGSRA